jgi:hypothetical protein
MKQVLRVCAAIAFSALLSGSAGAIVINTLNSPTAFIISEDEGGGLVLTATGTVSVTSGFNSSSLVLHVILNNASTLNGTPLTAAANVRLSGWGFGVNPNATGVTFTDASDGGLIDATMGSIPSLAAIEVCAWGGNSCSGGSNGGIQAGGGDTFDLVLAGFWGSAVTFDPLGVRFQTGLGSFEFTCGGSCAGASDIAAAVPEPGTLALVGIALLGLATVGRRRQMH